jgi:hypothetical protein
MNLIPYAGKETPAETKALAAEPKTYSNVQNARRAARKALAVCPGEADGFTVTERPDGTFAWLAVPVTDTRGELTAAEVRSLIAEGSVVALPAELDRTAGHTKEELDDMRRKLNTKAVAKAAKLLSPSEAMAISADTPASEWDEAKRAMAEARKARDKARSNARIGNLKAKQSGATKKMPLEGKAAIDAIVDPEPARPARKSAPKPAGTENKSAMIGRMLCRPEGTTTAEILAATGWPTVSVPAQAQAAKIRNLRKVKEGKTTRYFGE